MQRTHKTACVFAVSAIVFFSQGCGKPFVAEDTDGLVKSIVHVDAGGVSYALANVANIRARGGDGNSLLHLAARCDTRKLPYWNTGEASPGTAHTKTSKQYDYAKIVDDGILIARLLIDRDADVNAHNDNLDTPLHCTASTLRPDADDIPSIFPVYGRISSPFGWRNSPVAHSADYHRGIDIAAPSGTRIRTTASGVVEVTGIHEELGNYIIVRHSCGYETLYGHCYLFNINKDAKITRGDVIGYVGKTGNSIGDHCHYEVLLNGAAVDPEPYLRAKTDYTINMRISLGIADLLLQHGAMIDARNAAGRTPLHEASGKDPNLVKLLLRYNAEVNCMDNDGRTPLHEAAARSLKIVKMLVDHGAHPNPRTKGAYALINGMVLPTGSTPLKTAMLHGKRDIAAYLKRRGATL